MPVLLALALLLFGCEQSTPPSPMPPYFAAVSPTIEAICEEFGGIREIDDFRELYGEPIRTESKTAQNPYVEDEVDTYIRESLPEVDATYLVSVTASRPILLLSLRVHSKRAGRGPRGWVGTEVSEFVDVAGPPLKRTSADLEYWCDENNSISVELEDGVVDAFVWRPYTG